MPRILILVIACGIVLVLSVVICLAWWKLADRWFPDAARKTGQDITLRVRGRDRGRTRVIKDASRPTNEAPRRQSGPDA